MTVVQQTRQHRASRIPAALGRVVRDWWRGWSDRDAHSLNERLYDYRCFKDGMLKVTVREFRALPELNRRAAARENPAVTISIILLWVEGRGLIQVVRLL
jgi:hypothetical protein